MRIKILIRLKSQILEPQGKVIEKSLYNLGLSNLTNIRQGKLIELDISDTLSDEEKNDLITSACKKLLVNEIIEEYEVLG
jgi:phosphoribosylformylglycinamidine synthase PurS subunit